jgi:hypothetical protein
MCGQYGSAECARPSGAGCAEHDEDKSARLFLCGRCRQQVLICSCCDRGQIYCVDGCADAARRQSLREAGRRYQRSRDGRFAHAERNRRYRARQKIVTHQSSPPEAKDGLLQRSSAAIVNSAAGARIPPIAARHHCHWCGRRCPAFVRQGFLRRRAR